MADGVPLRSDLDWLAGAGGRRRAGASGLAGATRAGPGPLPEPDAAPGPPGVRCGSRATPTRPTSWATAGRTRRASCSSRSPTASCDGDLRRLAARLRGRLALPGADRRRQRHRRPARSTGWWRRTGSGNELLARVGPRLLGDSLELRLPPTGPGGSWSEAGRPPVPEGAHATTTRSTCSGSTPGSACCARGRLDAPLRVLDRCRDALGARCCRSAVAWRPCGPGRSRWDGRRLAAGRARRGARAMVERSTAAAWPAPRRPRRPWSLAALGLGLRGVWTAAGLAAAATPTRCGQLAGGQRRRGSRRRRPVLS